MIRKIQFAPANNKEGPKTEINKQFMMNDKPVQLEASLGKEVHEATIACLIQKMCPTLFFFDRKYFLKSRFITTAIPLILR